MLTSSHSRPWIPHAVKGNRAYHSLNHTCCLILPRPRPYRVPCDYMTESIKYVKDKFFPMETLCIPGLNHSKVKRNVTVPSGNYKGFTLPTAVKCSGLDICGVVLGSNDMERLSKMTVLEAINDFMKMLEYIFVGSKVKAIFLSTIFPRREFYYLGIMPFVEEFNTQIIKMHLQRKLRIYPNKFNKNGFYIQIIPVNMTSILNKQCTLSHSSYCQVCNDGVHFRSHIAERFLEELNSSIKTFIKRYHKKFNAVKPL